MSDSKPPYPVEHTAPYSTSQPSAPQPSSPGYSGSATVGIHHPGYPQLDGQQGYPPVASATPPPYSVTVGGQPQMKVHADQHVRAPTVTVVQPMAIAVVSPFGELPVNMNCPNCHSNILTSVHYDKGILTWLAAGVLCLFGCWLGCCLIPFCINATKDAVHKCPQCKTELGRCKRL